LIAAGKEPIHWDVPWGDTRRRYFVRAGSIEERSHMEADLAGPMRAREVYDFQLGAAFASGVQALLPDNPDDAARLIDLEQTERAGENLAPDEVGTLAEARDLLTEHWPAYRQLISQASRRAQFAPLVAFRRFCTGWEGEGLPPFKRGIDGQVDMETVAALPDIERKAVGAFAYALQYGLALKQPVPDDGDGDPGEESPSTKNPPGRFRSPAAARRLRVRG
jgi:hypothetical protein